MLEFLNRDQSTIRTLRAAHDSRRHDPGRGARHGAGHDRHAGHSVAMFRDKFWLTVLLTIPIVVLSHDLQMWLGYEIPSFPGSAYVPAVLGTAVFLYGGLVFLRGARGELSDQQPGMMTLISLAILVAWITSWAGTLGVFEVEIWWELSSLIAIMLLGHWLEMRSIAQARGALSALANSFPTWPSGSRQAGRKPSRSRRSQSATSSLFAPGRAFLQTATLWKAPRTSTSRCSPVSRGPSQGNRAIGSSPAPSPQVARSACG